MSIRDRIHGFLYPNSRTHVAAPNRPEFVQPFAAQRGLRRGMWVVVALDSAVGILTGLSADGRASVQLVDERGFDRMRLETQPNGEQKLVRNVWQGGIEMLRQAHTEEIPAPRRPDAATAQRFGYHRGQK